MINMSSMEISIEIYPIYFCLFPLFSPSNFEFIYEDREAAPSIDLSFFFFSLNPADIDRQVREV